MTHPLDTEFVIARPEFVFPIPDELSKYLAALVLYGGMTVYAVTRALKLTDGPVGVTGHGILANIVASILLSEGRQIALCHSNQAIDLKNICVGLQLEKNGESSLPAERATIWIETDDATVPKEYSAEQVIGVSVSLDTIRAVWPNARKHLSINIGDLEKDPDRVVDLYYYDGNCDWPDWFQPRYFQRYLELATKGRIILGHVPPKCDLGNISTTDKTIQKAVSDARSSRAGIIFTDFDAPLQSLSSGPIIIKQTSSTTRQVKKVSLIGAGRWALGMIVRQILCNKNIALRGVCDRRPEVLHLAYQTLPFEYATTNYEDLLNDEQTDMIIVATYHGAHAPLATLALQANKHCFVEKPPAINESQLETLIAAARCSGRMLYVGYNRRFAPITKILVEHLRKIEGPMSISMVIRSVDIPKKSWYFWPTNGNRIISNICHFTDYAFQLLGYSTPVSVMASPSTSGRLDQNVVVSITFADGSIASILYTDKGNRSMGEYDQRYQVMKGNLTARIDNFTRLTILEAGKQVAQWKGLPDMGHRQQMAAVADALLRENFSLVSLPFTEISARIYLAAARSAEIGEPVQLEAALKQTSIGSDGEQRTGSLSDVDVYQKQMTSGGEA